MCPPSLGDLSCAESSHLASDRFALWSGLKAGDCIGDLAMVPTTAGGVIALPRMRSPRSRPAGRSHFSRAIVRMARAQSAMSKAIERTPATPQCLLAANKRTLREPDSATTAITQARTPESRATP